MSATAMEIAPRNLEKLIAKVEEEPEHFDRIWEGIDTNHDEKVSE